MKYRQLLFAVLLPLILLPGCAVPVKPDAPPEKRQWTAAEFTGEFGDSDPWEGFNRSMFAVNRFGMLYVVRPVGWVYGSIFPRPAITCISRASSNLEFPARMFSAFLQAKFADGGVVFLRFLTNTTLGIGGLFDPADAWFDLYPRMENFGQTFECWGMGPGRTFILPFCRSTNVRDTTGELFDALFDIKTYLPYGASTFAGVNKAVSNYRPYYRMIHANWDGYELYKEYTLLQRRLEQRDWTLQMRRLAAEAKKTAKNTPPAPDSRPPRPEGIKGEIIHLPDYRPENAYSDTVRAAMFKSQSDEASIWSHLSLWNSDFANRADEREIPALRPGAPAMQYLFWRAPQEAKQNAAPLAFILPGIGSHQTSPAAVALAEVLFSQGYAVAILPSVYCWNFQESRFTATLPGYTPIDAMQLRRAIQDVLQDLGSLQGKKSFKPESVNLVGYSMGALHALHIAAKEESDPALGLNRVVAINPPVDLAYALTRVDDCEKTATGWSRERTLEVFPDAFGKAMAASNLIQPFIDPLAALPEAKLQTITHTPGYSYRTGLTQDQGKLINALAFRYTLRDVLALALRDNKITVPAGPYAANQRTALYRELDRISFADYMTAYLLPGCRKDLQQNLTPEQLQASAGLRIIEPTLRNNPKIRVLHNLDDYLCSDRDRRFLDEMLGSRITWFDRGAHLGNLYYGQLQQVVIDSLQGTATR